MLQGARNDSDYSECTTHPDFQCLLRFKHWLFGGSTKSLHLPTPQSLWALLSWPYPKQRGKLRCLTYNFGTVGHFLYMIEQLLYSSVHTCHQNGSHFGDSPAAPGIRPRTGSRRFGFRFFLLPGSHLFPALSTKKKLENCPPSSEARGLQRSSNKRSDKTKVKQSVFF